MSSTILYDVPPSQRSIWRHSRKYPQQTDEDREWKIHKNHILVFTYSGKPVYTRYGNEEALVNLTGTMTAIVSKMAQFFFNDKRKDTLRQLTTGGRRFYFCEKGPLWLVCITCHLETPPRELDSLLNRVHRQFLSILTAGVDRTLYARPNYDVRNLEDIIHYRFKC